MATQSFGLTLFPPSLAVGNEAAQDLLILGIHEFHAADFSLRTLEVIRKYTLGVRQSAGGQREGRREDSFRETHVCSFLFELLGEM